MNDYFTVDEFRRFAGERAGGKYSEDAIIEAQEEVISTLEAWARSAWPNVTGTAGDGTALAEREMTEELEYTGAKKLFTSMVPIIEVVSLNTISDVGITVVAVENYRVMERQGVIRLAAPPLRGTWGEYEITYTYGFTSCPREVKRPAMQATQALLRSDTPGKVPDKVSQMTTEATTFLYGTAGTQLAGPWPWAPDASEALRSFWGRDRPRRAGAA